MTCATWMSLSVPYIERTIELALPDIWIAFKNLVLLIVSDPGPLKNIQWPAPSDSTDRVSS